MAIVISSLDLPLDISPVYASLARLFIHMESTVTRTVNYVILSLFQLYTLFRGQYTTGTILPRSSMLPFRLRCDL